MNKHIGIYLRKDYLSSLSLEQYTTIMQQMRIINSLEFWLRMQLSVKEERSKILSTRNRVELIFNLISVYNECIKEYSKVIAKKLLCENIPTNIKNEISNFVTRFEGYKNDYFLEVSNMIRNEIMYHFHSDIYKSMIKDGEAKEDLLIGVGLSEKKKDFCFVAHYTFLFELIVQKLPPDVDKQDFLDWLTHETVKEVDLFTDHLYKVTISLINGNGYKKYLEDDYTI